jgi:tripartite-type tricarboxylate transporter receptor subunit TctC
MMSGFTRRRFLKASAAVGGAAMVGGLGVSEAFARKFPWKPFTAYQAGKPGGGTDRFSQNLFPEFQRLTGQPVNKLFTPGAGGILAGTKILAAPSDGHTLGIVAISTMNVSIHFNKPEQFGFGAFAYLGTMYVGPLAVFTGKDSKYTSIEQLVEDSKKEKISVAVTAARQMYHIGGMIFNKATGANFQYVPYGGGLASRRAAGSGEVPAVMTGLFDASANYDILRCLCIFGPKNPIPNIMKNVPTMHDVYGKKAVDLWHPTGICTSGEVEKENPDNYAFLVEKYEHAYKAKTTIDRQIKSGFPPEAVVYWSPEEIKEFEKDFIAQIRAIKL